MQSISSSSSLSPENSIYITPFLISQISKGLASNSTRKEVNEREAFQECMIYIQKNCFNKEPKNFFEDIRYVLISLTSSSTQFLEMEDYKLKIYVETLLIYLCENYTNLFELKIFDFHKDFITHLKFLNPLKTSEVAKCCGFFSSWVELEKKRCVIPGLTMFVSLFPTIKENSLRLYLTIQLNFELSLRGIKLSDLEEEVGKLKEQSFQRSEIRLFCDYINLQVSFKREAFFVYLSRHVSAEVIVKIIKESYKDVQDPEDQKNQVLSFCQVLIEECTDETILENLLHKISDAFSINEAWSEQIEAILGRSIFRTDKISKEQSFARRMSSFAWLLVASQSRKLEESGSEKLNKDSEYFHRCKIILCVRGLAKGTKNIKQNQTMKKFVTRYVELLFSDLSLLDDKSFNQTVRVLFEIFNSEMFSFKESLELFFQIQAKINIPLNLMIEFQDSFVKRLENYPFLSAENLLQERELLNKFPELVEKTLLFILTRIHETISKEENRMFTLSPTLSDAILAILEDFSKSERSHSFYKANRELFLSFLRVPFEAKYFLYSFSTKKPESIQADNQIVAFIDKVRKIFISFDQEGDEFEQCIYLKQIHMIFLALVELQKISKNPKEGVLSFLIKPTNFKNFLLQSLILICEKMNQMKNLPMVKLHTLMVYLSEVNFNPDDSAESRVLIEASSAYIEINREKKRLIKDI